VPDPIAITDPADERVADYRALTDVDLRTRWEPPHGLFIAEGELVLGRALRAGYRPRSVLVDAKRVDQVPPVDAPLYAATQEVLEATTGFHVHRGILASFHRRPLPDPAALLAGATRVAVLEDVNNHTNLGAVFRGAAALGMDAVLLSPSCADPLYRRSVRVSMGEVFAVPYTRLAPWPAALDQVRAAGFTLLALTPAADDRRLSGPAQVLAHDDRRLSGPAQVLAHEALALQRLPAAARQRPALLLGAEGAGLSQAALQAADHRVAIPMRNGVDSLNVAAAAAVAFWELNRD
jgi:tRNA G18 (ribose-2'-O)-methylase SpoU